MPYEVSNSAFSHRLTLDGREHLTVDGVENVERFDETCIVMQTCVGMLVVTGDALHIDKLSTAGGELHVDGQIDSLEYEQRTLHERGGLFSRLFGG